MRSRHVSQVIASTPDEVYAFAADPDHLPLWAAGLADVPVEREGDDLVAQSPMGQVRVRFVPANEHGILDHDVTLPSGEVVHNPLRVMRHPDGAEVVFTLRQLAMSDEAFERDAQLVAADLDRLRLLLER